MFTFQALYAGMSPQRALAIYAVITYMDSISGVWHPRGGMGAVVEARATAATRAGVQIDYGRTVTGLERGGPDNRVRGVRTEDGEQLAADAVISTLDLPFSYSQLLPDLKPPRKVVRGSYSPSAVVWHLGVRGDLPDDVIHHNIYFGEQWAEAFEALTQRHELMPDPSRLVSVPTVSEPSLAPEGGHVLYVLEPVPNNRSGIDWKADREPFRQGLLDFLSANGYPTDIRPSCGTARRMAERRHGLGHPSRCPTCCRRRAAAPQHRPAGAGHSSQARRPCRGRRAVVLIGGKLAADRVGELGGRW